MRILGEAEGEGFEPSSDLTARNGFRDRATTADLQGVFSPFASMFAIHRPSLASKLTTAAAVVDARTVACFGIGLRRLRLRLARLILRLVGTETILLPSARNANG
jgi:hypothetical protein